MKLTVASYNILHGENDELRQQGMHVIDLDRTAETIRALKADICGLNEVRNQNGEGLCNQAEVIAEKLGMHVFFAKAIHIQNGEYGNALLSRYPIRAAYTVPIQTTAQERGDRTHFEDRVLLVATLDVQGNPLTVMVCHFGLQDIEKEKAIALLRQEVEKVDTPLIFMGDLNLTPDTAYYRELTSFLQDSCEETSAAVYTFARSERSCKIDYIFTNSACRVRLFGVAEIGVSDRLPIRAEIEF